MADFERKSAIDVHAGVQPVAAGPLTPAPVAAACNHAFVIPSAVHRATVLVDNRLPPHPVKTLSLGLRCPASTIFAGWRQSVLPVHLLGLDALLSSIGPVAGDVKLQDDGVVHDPVNRRGGGHGVGEDALPLREDQV